MRMIRWNASSRKSRNGWNIRTNRKNREKRPENVKKKRGDGMARRHVYMMQEALQIFDKKALCVFVHDA